MSKVDPQHGDPTGKGPFGSTQDGAVSPEHDDNLDTALAWVHLAGIDRRQRHPGDLLLQGVALIGKHHAGHTLLGDTGDELPGSVKGILPNGM